MSGFRAAVAQAPQRTGATFTARAPLGPSHRIRIGTIAHALNGEARGKGRGRRSAALLLGLFTFVAGFTGAGIASSEAAAETRTLNLYYTHTKKSAKITFKKNGRYLKSGLNKANKFLADWRTGQQIKIDPRLLDTVWEVYQRTGSRKPIHVVSSYRSPKTNAMLRRTRGGQAKKSQHMVGKALDFFVPGVSAKKMRELGLKAQAGGVGYYPKSGFVHLDTGRVRHWPRMSRRELVRVFPNGKTLHVPTDGKALPGYKTAQANYKRRMASGGGVADDLKRVGGGGLLKRILGGGGNDEPATSSPAAPAAAPEVQVAALPRRGPAVASRPGANIRTVAPEDVEALPGVETGPANASGAAPDVPADTETIVASLPDLPPVPAFRPGNGDAELTPTVETVIADAASSAPRPVLRPGDAGATAVASLGTNPLVLGYAPTVADKPAARALARVGRIGSGDVAARSLAREDDLLAAIERSGSASTPSAMVPDTGKRPELTETALRLAFARSTTDVSARRQELLARAGTMRARLATPAVSLEAKPAKIERAKIEALAAALRAQAAAQ